MTPTNSRDSHPRTTDYAVACDGLIGVVRTRRREPARRWAHGRPLLVHVNGLSGSSFHRLELPFTIDFSTFFISSSTCSCKSENEHFVAPGRTISSPAPIGIMSTDLSRSCTIARSCRRRRLRTTALPTFFEIANAICRSGASAGRNRSRKSDDRTC